MKKKVAQTISRGIRGLVSGIAEMRILDILLPREPIGGIEISESGLRFAFLKRGKREVTVFQEAPLREGLIVNGVPQDTDTLAYFITITFDHLTKGKKLARKFIVSVPDAVIYSQPFFIPLGLQEEEEMSFMKNNFHTICPFAYEEVYVDWQDVSVLGNKKIVLVTAGLRSVIDTYRNALSIAGVEQVALEPFSLSFQRMTDTPDGCHISFLHTGRDMLTIVSIDQRPYLVRSTPVFHEKEIAIEERVMREIRRLEEFIAPVAKKKQISFSFFSLTDAMDGETFVRIMKEKGIEIQEARLREVKSRDKSFNLLRFAGATGSAVRGLIPRAKDTIVSILPVGTERAYVQMKRKIFFTTLRNITIGTAALLLISFAGLYVFLSTVTEREVQRVSAQREALPSHIGAIQESVRTFNAHVESLTQIQEMIHSPLPSLSAIEEIILMQGVTISSMDVVQQEHSAHITIRGVASTRDQFRLLREHMELSQFSDVNFPIFAIVESTDIPFTISFTYATSE